MTPLSDRLAALTGPDREVDREVWRFLCPDARDDEYHQVCALLPFDVSRERAEEETDYHAPRWTSDLNVIVAEIERRGWSWERWLAFNNKMSMGVRPIDANTFIAQAPTPCLALLRALVAAVESP